MTNPWDTADPFAVMFCDTVQVSGVRPEGRSFRGSFSACVYPPERDEPFDGSDADTELRRLRLLITKRGIRAWNRETPPQTGDEILLENGSKWKVTDVDDMLNWYQMEARSC